MYWRRRVFVLGIAFALVFVTARLLTAGSDARSGDQPAAEQVGGRADGQVGVEPTDSTDSTGEQGAGADGSGATAPTEPVTPALAEPQGECDPADVVVTPSVAEGAVAGRDVPVTLTLQTRESPACTWQVNASTVVVKVARDSGDVWTTRQCPQALADQPVVVRQAVTTTVQVIWAEARESTDGCTRRAGWVKPGTFTVAAAALGGEPAHADFALGAPAPETIQVTPKAKHTKKAEKPKTPTN
ncbi:hypothetical protein RB608_13965 [Nocardioides sp. LHD-245]|uniref:hypothetical protein n=1 Tax=Nocardioides sp. LHD-245 TaxID=3051387 RepID=UPI0027E08E48|nr:hypothetical protein [Nocardioides sp. LHD-245]